MSQLQVDPSALRAAGARVARSADDLSDLARRLSALDPGALGPRLAPALGELLDAATTVVADLATTATRHADALAQTGRDVEEADRAVADLLREVVGRVLR